MNDRKSSAVDQRHLQTLEPKLQVIRDRTRGVAQGYHPGMYVWGEGGTSKSFTILETLKACHAEYTTHNSRLSGRGLFDDLKELPTSIHVIDDCESMLADSMAIGVLRSALWSQSKKRPMEREVTWRAHGVNLRFIFTGGIILIANKDVAKIPELKALKTRIRPLQLVVTFNEIAALMRSVALRGLEFGPDYLTPRECMTVAEYVIGRMREIDRPLDMRVYVNGVKDFLQHKMGDSETDWKDLVETALRETTILRESRAERVARETAIALEIAGRDDLTQAQKLAEWRRRTGKSDRAYWRRLE
jgi:hypothetical protein